jgi:hypothetical protein
LTDKQQTPAPGPKFDFNSYSGDVLVHDRRSGCDRRECGSALAQDGQTLSISSERRAPKERRRRIDPTTFEKQYTPDELKFMNAMQQFKVQSGKGFPTLREVIKVAVELGYRKGTTPTARKRPAPIAPGMAGE